MRIAEQIRTTTFLVALRYMVLFFISVTILMAIINWAIVEYVKERDDRTVMAAIQTFSILHQQAGLPAVAAVMEAWQSAETRSDMLFALADAKFVLRAGNLPAWPNIEPVNDGWIVFSYSGSDGNTVGARGRVAALGQDTWIVVAHEASDLGGLNKVLDRAFVLILGSTLLMALVGGLLMSNKVLQRVNEINLISRKITAGDFSLRMPTGKSRDEFDELSRNLNNMLEQTQSLLESIRHISDDIAHDLRTPLTRLRNQLEKLRSRSSVKDTSEIDACLENADQLLATFASLLSITRIESGASDASLVAMDLCEVAQDACELYQALAEDSDIELSCDAPSVLRIRGDRNLVFQALTNLLDNAIKYTPAGGYLKVEIAESNDRIILKVRDSGPGISEELREKVLQRFYRLDESRSAPGAGLGLSLVNAIAQRHKAELSLGDNEPGLVVTLSFPALVKTQQVNV